VVFDFDGTDDNEAHIARHGVTPKEAEQATERTFYSMPGRDGTALLFGQALSGPLPARGPRRVR